MMRTPQLSQKYVVVEAGKQQLGLFIHPFHFYPNGIVNVLGMRDVDWATCKMIPIS